MKNKAAQSLPAKHYPGLAGKAYFNFGGQGVMSQPSLDAIFEAYQYVQREGPFSSKMFSWIGQQLNDTKELLAAVFGGSAHCFALTQNVTEAVNILLWGLNWQAGDSIMITDCEHPGVVDAVNNLVRRLKLNLIEVAVQSLDGQELVDSIEKQISKDGRTRLFVFSHVLWNSGKVLPLKEINNLCRQYGVLALADGAQSAGVLPLSLRDYDSDFYAFTGQKWLCGPEGTGALYVKESLLGKLEPTYMGWRHHLHGSERGAEKYEIATSSFPLLAGLRAALKCHQEAGDDRSRYVKIMANLNYLKSSLEELGVQTVAGAGASGLLSFKAPGKNHNQLVTDLESDGVYVRSIPEPDCLRASIHYLTESDDVDRLLAAVKKRL